MTTQKSDALLSSKQVSEPLGVSPVTLCRWRGEGKGPPFIKLSYARVGYPIGKYREWLEAQTVG